MADDHANGLLGDYRLIRILGSGRTSTVYLAEHPAYGQVALKRLHPEARDVRLPDGRLLRERFVEERDVLKELRYHLEERTPSLPADADTVPDCLDLVENEENLFMAITLARGRSVTDWLEDWPDGLGEARYSYCPPPSQCSTHFASELAPHLQRHPVWKPFLGSGCRSARLQRSPDGH